MVEAAAGMAVLLALFLATRHFRLKREIRRTARQLSQLNDDVTEKKIDLVMMDKDMEKLAVEVNRQIDATKRANAERRRTENELKQAISHISHDIRTPMTSILGYVQLLEAEELSPGERSEYVAVVKSGALRLKDLLQDFFELSIIESADYPIRLESVKLNQAVLDVLAGFYEEFNKRRIEPIIQMPTEEMRIHADLSAVKRVIENLLLNAIRHSSGAVTITLHKRESCVELTISNAAHTLSEADVARLFDRFFKVDKTRSGEGTGLGLAIAKSLTTKTGGQLTAKLSGGQLEMRCEWRS